MEKKIKLLGILILFTILACKKSTKSPEILDQEIEIETQVLTQNLTHPWELVWGPDNLLWMTERGGRIIRVNS
jgi:glucose/arabinose dehydrogenase